MSIARAWMTNVVHGKRHSAPQDTFSKVSLTKYPKKNPVMRYIGEQARRLQDAATLVQNLGKVVCNLSHAAWYNCALRVGAQLPKSLREPW